MRKNRSRTSLRIKGVAAREEGLMIQARMYAETTGGRWVEHGPIYTIDVPWDAIYDTDAGDWMNAVHLERVNAAGNRAAPEDVPLSGIDWGTGCN